MRSFLASCLLLASPVQACDIALVLAVDISGSVDTREFRIQMDGLAEALRDGAVSEALVRAEARVTLLQWTGASRQRVSIPWVAVTDFETADALADQVADTRRVWRNFSTAIGEALVASVGAFDAVPDCSRRVIDVSGDGFSNEGIPPQEVRASLAEAGITVNALAIEESQPGLTEYYREHVIWGAGSFAVTADRFEDYPRRIRQKLLREVTEQVSNLPVR